MHRRDFLTMSAALAGSGFLSSLRAAPQDRPNILMIPVDDLKPLLACYGIEEILTPNIDRLAARGTVFLNNACQQAVCGPTRASLMTGLYPDSTGVWDLKTRMRDVNPDVLSLPQYLIANGYETTGVGKTYDPRCVDRKLDEPSWSIPYGSEKRRFAENHPRPSWGYQNPETKAAIKRGREAIKGRKFNSGGARKRALAAAAGSMASPATECMDLPDNAYPDGALAEAGCRLLKKLAAGSRPFFLSVGFYKPHLPFVAPKKYWDLYDREAIEPHPYQKPSEGGPEIAYHNSGELRSYSDMPKTGPFSRAQQIELIHGYRACVSYVDAQVGKLLDTLDELGLTDSTVVCLWGDHGWHLGDHAMWCKHSNFEQAVRAPLIVASPSLPGNRKTTAPTGFIDVFPTLCDLAGLPVPSSCQGTSLTPLMQNPDGSVREAVLAQYPRKVDGLPVMGYTLRDRRYRYVKWIQMNYRLGKRTGRLVARELYDYETDPMETVNQAENSEYADVVDRLEAVFARMDVAQHTGTYSRIQKEKVLHGVGRVQYNGAGRHLAPRTVEVTGQPFDLAYEVTVIEVPDRRSQAAYKRPIMIPIEAGKTYRVSFYCRSEKGAEFFAIFQKNGAPYKQVGSKTVKAGPDWQRVEIEGTPEQSYDAGGTVLTCHLGDRRQSVRFADVRVEEVP